jgi:hypothetical protein
MFDVTETLEKSMVHDWSGSISSQAASLARILVVLESRLESQANEAACGRISLASLGRFDQDSYSLKTSQVSLITNQCEEFSETFPPCGLMRNGECFRLLSSERPTSGNEYSLLPTPTRSMGQRGWGISKSGRNRYSQRVIQNAAGFGYKPPIWLLEWEMGFPRDFTDPAGKSSATLFHQSSQSGSDAES